MMMIILLKTTPIIRNSKLNSHSLSRSLCTYVCVSWFQTKKHKYCEYLDLAYIYYDYDY